MKLLPTRRVRFVGAGLLGLAVACTALAEVPATQPDVQDAAKYLAPKRSDRAAARVPASRPSPTVRVSPFGDRLLRLSDILGPALRYNRDIAEPAEPADEEEWQEIVTFAKQNFPNRWAQFEAVQNQRGPDSPTVVGLKERMTTRYRTLQKLQNQMPSLYDAAVRQGRLEDDAWAATVRARRNPKDASLAKTLREKVGALVKDVLQERQDRIEAIRQTLQDEQDRLDADQKGVDKLIDRQITRLTGDRPFESDLPNRWGGPGGGRGFGPGGPPSGNFPGRWDGPPRGEGRRRPDNSNDAPSTQPADAQPGTAPTAFQ
ncbi:MAG: hypothetical protein JWM57_2990 [Phycisphaerales bacterium]|nr:hypothetical protein [Phycisphaerales bacterium]